MAFDVFSDDAGRASFLALAARIFAVEVSSLSLETERASLPEWDSINHLRLVMEAEQAFDVHYPLERIPELKQLGDFLQA